MNDLINPVKFVNKDTGEEIKKVIDPELKEYLLLITEESDDVYTWFEFFKGRTQIYEYIVSMFRELDTDTRLIDVYNSYVLVENVSLKDRVTLYEFMKHMEIYFPESSFDIEDYTVGDDDVDETESKNDVESIITTTAPFNNTLLESDIESEDI